MNGLQRISHKLFPGLFKRSALRALESGHRDTLRRPYTRKIGKTDAEFGTLEGIYFPLQYLLDMFSFIRQNAEFLNVLTYEDLGIQDGHGYKSNFEAEYLAWTAHVAAVPAAYQKAHILLQYDIDRAPERLHALLAAPEHDKVPANVMIFNERVDRWRLQSIGEVATTPYALDRDLLLRRQKEGFVIGYHTNAYELAGHNVDKALEIFDRDMTTLSQAYGTRFFSAHGGVPDAEGNNNNTLPYHPDWIDRAVWVHNGHNLRFDGVFSDGGHNSPKRDPKKRDLRRFFETMQPGKRYRILLHPQYYGIDYGVSKRFVGTPWYDDLIGQALKNPKQSTWSNVRLPFKADGQL